MLKRYHRAGFDVVHLQDPARHLLANGDAFISLPMALDWSLSELGASLACVVQAGVVEATLLSLALSGHSIACALLLLDKYRRRRCPDSAFVRMP